ncbi:MAG: NAD(P)H-dependent oxidoreductase subunit E [Deltaproteobacteria bacterium]|nr:NAD(P)H-dependent oxidoreductase subunit E [Deltaproteobacteria bacterium]
MQTTAPKSENKEELEKEISEGDIVAILDKHKENHGALIAILEEIQIEYGYLPEKALRLVSEKTNRSLVDIYGIATFYRFFSLKPRGKHLISVCLGTACHVRGAPLVAAELKRQLGIDSGETTEDKEFTLETVNCLGACALGPVVVIDGHYFSKVNRTQVEKLISDAQEGLDKMEVDQDKRTFPVDVSCPRCNHSLMDDSYYIEGRPSVRVTVSSGDEHGWLRLSSIYGRYNVFSEYEIPLDMVMHFFCPHCHGELIGSWICPTCKAPMVSMMVRGGGVVRICSRRGCSGSRSHMLDLL